MFKRIFFPGRRNPLVSSFKLHSRFALHVFLFLQVFFLVPSLVWGSNTNLTCPKLSDYRIISSSIVLVQCTPAFANSMVLLDLNLLIVHDTAITAAPVVLRATLMAGTTDWVAIELSSKTGEVKDLLQPRQRYIFALTDPSADGHVISKVDVETNPTATTVQDPLDNIRSHVSCQFTYGTDSSGTGRY